MEKYIGIFNSSFSKYTVLDISFIVIFFSIIQLISLEIFMYRVFQESIVMDKTVISFFRLIQSITEMNKVEFVFRLKKKEKIKFTLLSSFLCPHRHDDFLVADPPL